MKSGPKVMRFGVNVVKSGAKVIIFAPIVMKFSEKDMNSG